MVFDMKKILSLLSIIILCITFVLPSSAEEGVQPIPNERLKSRLVDEADLLTQAEEKILLEKLDEISERQKFDLAIVTVKSLNGKTSRDYADDYFDYNGYGYGEKRDGALFLICPEERDWWFSTHAFGIKAFTDAGIDRFMVSVKTPLKNDKYNKAFNELANQCDKYLTQANTGKAYDVGNLPRLKMQNPLTNIIISIAVGLVISFFIVSAMKHSLKSVKLQNKADAYQRKDSLNITNNQDRFLYNKVTSTIRSNDSSSGGSSSHSSSSGSSHGGSGGKY